MAASVIGHTNTFSVLKMATVSSKSLRQQSILTTCVRFTWQNWYATHCETWGVTLPVPMCWSAVQAIGRMSGTPVTAAVKWWFANWPKWELKSEFMSKDHFWKRFFRNQEELAQLRVQKDIRSALHGADALVLAVPHAPYLQLEPKDVVAWVGQPLAIVDCFGILTDAKIREYLKLGCEVKALGRGHIKRLKEELRG
jgi:hypothetical protein